MPNCILTEQQRGYGGMVYTRDLKSLDFGHAGSSLATRTK